MLNYEFPPLGGGAANANLHLLKELAKHPQLKIDLVTSSTDKFRQEQFASNIKIYFLDIGKRGRNGHYQKAEELVRYSIRSYLFARRLLKKKNYDFIHAWFGIPPGAVGRLLGKPCLIALRGTDTPFFNPRFRLLDYLLFRHIYRFIWSKAKVVTANSQNLKELAQLSRPRQKIHVICNGVDTSQFHPQKEKPHQEFTVLSTSRLTKRKGIEYLISGYFKFQQTVPDSQLILIGDGDLRSKLERQAEQLNISTKVIFKGAVPHNEIAPIYRQADIFVLPSTNEGMSNSLLEAMASGLPIITTDTGGTAELVDESNGIIVEKKDSQEIAHALSRLYHNRELTERMGQSSRRKAEKLSWTQMAESYLELYEKILSKLK